MLQTNPQDFSGSLGELAPPVGGGVRCPWSFCWSGVSRFSTNLGVRFTPRKRLNHDVPSWVEEGNFFFITIKCTDRGRNQLCHAGRGDAILDAARFYHEKLKWHCRLMLLMPDHIHAIIAFPDSAGMKRIVGSWKRFLTRHESTDWQDDFFDHRLRNRHDEMEKIEYILNNPVRAGLCEQVENWPWIYRPNDRPPPRLVD